jgi:hypothetical protein
MNYIETVQLDPNISKDLTDKATKYIHDLQPKYMSPGWYVIYYHSVKEKVLYAAEEIWKRLSKKEKIFLAQIRVLPRPEPYG